MPLQGTGIPVDRNVKEAHPINGTIPLFVLVNANLPVFVVEQSRVTCFILICSNIVNIVRVIELKCTFQVKVLPQQNTSITSIGLFYPLILHLA
jgi:DMSO reductase anchor subunit